MLIMKTLTRLALLAALLVFSVPTRAPAQTSIAIGPRAGYEVGDVQTPFVGGDLRIGVGALPVRLNATYDAYLGEGADLYQFAANALYDFEGGGRNRVFTPYAGAGLSVAGYDAEGDDDSVTDTALNLLFGAEFEATARFRPFVQAEFTVFGELDLYDVSGGLLFTF
jgi:opacity protein-like surface antigen